MIYKMLLEDDNGDQFLASREAYMMCHPARDRDCEMVEGDIVELEEGFFVLNQDLNPMERATEEQVKKAEDHG